MQAKSFAAREHTSLTRLIEEGLSDAADEADFADGGLGLFARRAPGQTRRNPTAQPYVSVFCSWNTARKQAGLAEVRMHDLRHSMASNMVNSGRSILEVAKVLGHPQLKTSQRYSRLSNETLLAAVDASAKATNCEISIRLQPIKKPPATR